MEHSTNTIFISNIPPSQNNIPSLIRHFRRFGHIDAIWSHGSRASITFQLEESAKAAVECSEAYAQNRFININYHNNSNNGAANLALACDMDRVREQNKKVQASVEKERKATQFLQNHMKSSLNGNNSFDLAQLQNALDSYTEEANSLFEQINDDIPPEEKSEKQKRLLELSGLIDSAQSELEIFQTIHAK